MDATKTSDSSRKNYYRVQLDFSEEAYQEMLLLQEKLDAVTCAEVIRNALGVLRWVVNHISEGDKIKVEKKIDGTSVELVAPFRVLKKT